MSLGDTPRNNNRRYTERDPAFPLDEFGRFCDKLAFVRNPALQTPCAVWVGSKDSKGYGLFGRQGRTRRAHRLSFEWAFGPIPEGMQVHHKAGCIGPSCVNVQHLQAVTPAEHFQLHAKVVCCNGHPRTVENVAILPNKDGYPRRACRPCRRESARRLQERQQQARAAQERRSA